MDGCAYCKEENTAKNAFWLVWNPEGNLPKAVHDTKQSAYNEAIRLARRNPKARFADMREKTKNED